MAPSLLRLLAMQCRLDLMPASLPMTAWLLSGCKKRDSDATPAPTVRLATNATLGSLLTDEQGNMLYYFTLDVTGSNNCGTSACATEWPVFYAATVTVGPGLSTTDFTTSKTASGLNQTLYKGWPLYYYAAPANGQVVRELPGETHGNGLGDAWYVVRPDYSVMMAMGAVANSTTSQTVFKPYLIDPQGRTLYTYNADITHPTTKATNCAGGCADAWPVFTRQRLRCPPG